MSKQKYDNTNKGAIWKGKTKNGETYFTIKFNFLGQDIQAKIFKNTYKKEGDNQPDYNFTLESAQATGQVVAKQSPAPQPVPDAELPF